ncbi:MAG: hypothetical protein A3C06_00070 [Candidatus Taylorbacteria bacterium RIFCSPHIGHO2_02_FULL_46_13]|uniref:Uncharacterized protein n=1 Tax=Candidatus Taylorbacteria bacterium RIFCSPHIGHO2_02_FULL_46_13 TaxID=1802312 RepID=A0A1G2MS63_9BACT|nr:MAG: hypothetical protein A3C06_00070 [Candidatus Taylorbacteria bacterium RIFCSPHIGHO2_02_FULL_46_13]
MRIPEYWTFAKVAHRAAHLLAEGWQVKKRVGDGEISFKPPGGKRFCFCAIEALGRHFIGPTIRPGDYPEAARDMGINARLRLDVMTANDSPVNFCLGDDLVDYSENRTLLLVSLGLPLDRGWQNCVSDKFKQRVQKVLSSRQPKK